MKNLVFVLIMLLTLPALALADGTYDVDAFSGANEITVGPEAVEQEAAPEAEFRVDEGLYAASIGSNGYYGGGFYGEEKYDAQILLYATTSYRTDFGFRRGFIVVNDQLVPINFASPFLTPFNLSGVFINSGIGIRFGGIGFRIR